MRVSDFIAKTLLEHGITRVYGLMGGGASGLNDGFIKNGNINYICFHHEQGAGYAAYGESRSTGKLSVINPTTGCGGVNCLTPVLNAWQDSVPLLIISGNVRKAHTTNFINKTKEIFLRKYGVQEHDITTTVKNITKYSKVIETPQEIKLELLKAIDIAQTGRKGPVWLDIPSDIQTSIIDENSLLQYEKVTQQIGNKKEAILKIEEHLQASSRPILLAGGGIPISKRDQFKQFVEKYNIPVVTTFMGKELLDYRHDLNLGVIGIKGIRAANFAMQHSDFLLVMGCSLNSVHVGYDESQFAPHSYRMLLDIDENEYKKRTVRIDEFIKIDLNIFFGDENE